MSAAVLRWYEPTDFPALQHGPHARRPHGSDSGGTFFNRLAEGRLTSLGVAQDKFYYPNLVVVVLYHEDQKTKKISNDAKILVKPDGMVMCEVEVDGKEIILRREMHFYLFEVYVKFTFFTDTKFTLKGHLGNEKGGGEAELETPTPRFVKNIRVTGMMGAKSGLLSVTGQVL